MVQVRGIRTKLHHAGEAWCRGRTTWPIDCPDGVTRCVTIPNWKWGLWSPEYGPDAFTAGPLARHVAPAWDHAQVFARHFDPTAALGDALVFNIDLYHRRPNYWPANENTRAMADRLPRVPSAPLPPWKKGAVFKVFGRRCRTAPLQDCITANLERKRG